MSPTHRTRQTGKRQPAWASFGDEELLQVRLKDLKVQIAGTWIEACLDRMHEELQSRNIPVRAHAWLADEWFSPHDSPGIAIPFYLAHPRLMRLERKKVLEVEGGSVRECMRILRHEAGHVLQRAYGLHRRKRWRELFGSSAIPYPDHYRPNPASRRYVQHLPRWYAQCHPDEDFAETFAVWLTPRTNWRKFYADWPALEKLNYVDELMSELAGVRPKLKRRIEIEPLRENSKTLAQYYVEKRERYAVDAPTVFDRELTRIFSDEPKHRGAQQASSFIRRHRGAIRKSVARGTGEYPLALEAALDDIADRARVMKLRAPGPEGKLRLELTSLLSSKAVHTLYSASRRQTFAV